MYDIEIRKSDEVTIPMSQDLCYSNGDLVVFLEGNKLDYRKILRHFGKDIYALTNHYEKFRQMTSLKGQIYFPLNEEEICKIENNAIQTRQLSGIVRSPLTEPVLCCLGTDGNYLYGEFYEYIFGDTKGRIIVLDEKLRPRNYFHSVGSGFEQSISARGAFFHSASSLGWDVYKKGKKTATLKIPNDVCARAGKSLAGLLDESDNPSDFFLSCFSDGNNLYALTSQGRVLHVRDYDAPQIDTIDGEIGLCVQSVSTGNEAILLAAGQVRAYANGRLVCANESELVDWDIEGAVVDSQFMYVSTGDTIHRFVILR